MEPEVVDTTKEQKPLYRNKKIIILVGVIVIILISVLIAVIALSNRVQPPVSDETGQAPTENSEILASIKFESPAVEAIANNPVTVDILVNSGGEPISAVVIVLKFDPAVVSGVTLQQFRDPQSALANIFENVEAEVDYVEGLSWIALSFPENVPPQAGSGVVARLTFTPATDTAISFAPNSALLSRLSENPIPANLPDLNVRVTNLAPDAQERLLQQQQELAQ